MFTPWLSLVFWSTQNNPVWRELLYPSKYPSLMLTYVTCFQVICEVGVCTFWLSSLGPSSGKQKWTHTFHQSEELILTAPTHSPDQHSPSSPSSTCISGHQHEF